MHCWKELVKLYPTMYDRRDLEQQIIILDLDVFTIIVGRSQVKRLLLNIFVDRIIVGRSQVKRLLFNIL